MKRLFCAIGLFFVFPLYAENTQTPNQPLGRGINVFNDKVFEDSPSQSTPPAAAGGVTRPRGDDANYNKKQRDEWIAACDKEREKSSAEFKKCFEANKSKALGEVQRKQSDIELRQSAPARMNVPKIQDMDEPREPAFNKDVTIEKQEE
jgi:hypothetical protein